MSYGLIQSGRGMKGEALQGLSDVARNNEQREQTNQGLKDAKRSQEMSTMATGAVTGAMAASGAKAGMFAGPMGMAIGAGLGLLAGWALS